MKLAMSPQHVALRQELRAYYERLLTPEDLADVRRNEGVGPTARRIVRQMGADGWLGIGWPKEYGGRGMTPIEQFIFFDESMRAGAPVPMLTVNSVAPTIMQYGTDEQKRFYLPRILAGEIHFAIGYTEPEAGTDLASLKTRAVRDGDDFVINGQKVFTSLATDADYVWLAVRTDPEAPKHKGISIIIVPTNTAGFRCTPIHNMGNTNTNQTFYDDVRVPAANLVGRLNGGWKLITNQLNLERVTLCSSGMIGGLFEEVMRWTKQTRLADGRRVIDQPWVQLNLARIHARIEFLRLINFKVAWEAEQNLPLNPALCSAIKVFGTEFYLEACRLMLEVMGAAANVRGGSPDAVADGRIGFFVRAIHILTFGGGTNELQRDLIALFGLGMPVMPRF
jgi:alkylation response protein AidB-like acyl-CoA dehydrogenase